MKRSIKITSALLVLVLLLAQVVCVSAATNYNPSTLDLHEADGSLHQNSHRQGHWRYGELHLDAQLQHGWPDGG